MLHQDQTLLSLSLQLLIVSCTFKSSILNASKALLSPTASGLVSLHAPFHCSFQPLALLPSISFSHFIFSFVLVSILKTTSHFQGNNILKINFPFVVSYIGFLHKQHFSCFNSYSNIFIVDILENNCETSLLWVLCSLAELTEIIYRAKCYFAWAGWEI